MPAVSPGCEVLVRWLLPAMTLLMLLGCDGPDGVDGEPEGMFRIFARYGTGSTNFFPGESPRLEVHLTGRRWRGLRDGVSDSARAVARYALANLPDDMPRPDTIVVTFRTKYLNLLVTRITSTIGDTLAVAAL